MLSCKFGNEIDGITKIIDLFISINQKKSSFCKPKNNIIWISMKQNGIFRWGLKRDLNQL